MLYYYKKKSLQKTEDPFNQLKINNFYKLKTPFSAPA